MNTNRLLSCLTSIAILFSMMCYFPFKMTSIITANAESTLLYPLPEGSFTLTCSYSSGHRAVDWGTYGRKTGVPIYAVEDGVVHSAQVCGTYGVLIVIWHESLGRYTAYAHCENTNYVTVGSTVKRGDTIATVGMTGNTSGPHLHFMIFKQMQSSSSPYPAESTCENPLSYSYSYKVNNVSEIVTPNISFDKSTYELGDVVNISWLSSPADSNLSHYWLQITAPDGTRILNETMDYNTSYSFFPSDKGEYTVTAWATPRGSLEGEGSLTDTKKIIVKDPKWFGDMTPVDVGTNFYAYIINVEPWKMLTNVDGNIVISTETVTANQIWKFSRNNDGSYKIINCKNGECLDVYGCYSESGTNVQTYKEHESKAQQWFIYGSSGDYFLRAACSDCVLDVSGGSGDDGANVQIFEKNDSTAQKFQIWNLTPQLSVYSGDKVNLTSFAWDAFPGDEGTYDLKIWKDNLWEGDSYKTIWTLKENTQYIDLPVGHYEAYIDIHVGTEMIMSNVVKFDVEEEYFGKSALSVKPGDKSNKTTFNWTKVEKADHYDLKIWNGTVWEGEAYQIEYNIDRTSVELALPSGYYEAYVDAILGEKYQMSNVVKFEVIIEGDCNNDGEFNISDIVAFQNWLLGRTTKLENWKAADLCEDGKLNVFDLCLLRRKLIYG